MSIDYKALNRQQDFNTAQKASLRKIFMAGEAAANPSTSANISRTLIHLALSGHFGGDQQHDIQALFKEIRSAIDADDNSRDIVSVVGSFRMGGNKKRVIRVMSEALIAQISA